MRRVDRAVCIDMKDRDFANRTRYILSELDNVEAGRPVAHPEQIPDYRKPSREGGEFYSSCPTLLRAPPPYHTQPSILHPPSWS